MPLTRAYIKKIVSNPPHLLAQKAVRKVFGRIEYLWCKFRDLKHDTRRDHRCPLIDRSLLKLAPDVFSTLPLETLRSSVNHYVNHEFDLLGSGWTRTGYGDPCSGIEGIRYDSSPTITQFDPEGNWLADLLLPTHLRKSKAVWRNVSPGYRPIDWQRDFKCGFRWDARTWYKEQRFGTWRGADIKVPWELARMQHLPQMAVLAVSEPEMRPQLTTEFKNQVLDFIATNPPRMGANWVCTMDVGIRAANLLMAYDFFTQLDTQNILDRDFKQIFAHSIYDHGLHIVRNLEWGTQLNSNHYLSDIAGLFFIAVYLPDACNEKKKWFQFALSELKKELGLQIQADGTDYEASTCYHRLVLELFFYPVVLAVRSDPRFDRVGFLDIAKGIFGPAYLDRLYTMFDAVNILLKPDGRMPQIGDNDSGRFIKLLPRPVLDMRYLLALGAVFFNEPAWKIREFFPTEADWEEVPVLFGNHGKNLWTALPDSPLDQISSRSFPDSGWYVMRHGQNYCLATCGHNGIEGRGSHSHNDKLSFELFCDGKDVLVDPGSYIYTSAPDKRNKFRGTAIHNTVSVDGREQNGLEKHLFSLDNDANPRRIKWQPQTEIDTFTGQHEGYCRLENPVLHQRTFTFYKKEGKLVITDRFTGHGEHHLRWSLVLSPDFDKKISVQSPLAWIETDECFSPGYGTLLPTHKYEASVKTTLPFETTIEIRLE